MPGGPRNRTPRFLAAVALGGVAAALATLFRRGLGAPAHTLPQAWGRTLETLWRDRTVAFQSVGHGAPVVLLHALEPGASAAEWQGVALRLGERYEVRAPDLPGWGSSAAAGAGVSVELLARFLVDFLDGVVRQPAVVVAAGMAAAVAVAAAAQSDAGVRALALVCPEGLLAIDRLHGGLATLLQLPIVGDWALDLLSTRTALRRHLEEGLVVAPERVDAALVERMHAAARRPGAAAALRAYWSGALRPAEPLPLEALTSPTWLAWGRRARQPAVAEAASWSRRLPDAHLEVFEGCGTLPHLETPVRFAQRLEAFVDSLAGASRDGRIDEPPGEHER